MLQDEFLQKSGATEPVSLNLVQQVPRFSLADKRPCMSKTSDTLDQGMGLIGLQNRRTGNISTPDGEPLICHITLKDCYKM
jgi:hypothetical protein